MYSLESKSLNGDKTPLVSFHSNAFFQSFLASLGIRILPEEMWRSGNGHSPHPSFSLGAWLPMAAADGFASWVHMGSYVLNAIGLPRSVKGPPHLRARSWRSARSAFPSASTKDQSPWTGCLDIYSTLGPLAVKQASWNVAFADKRRKCRLPENCRSPLLTLCYQASNTTPLGHAISEASSFPFFNKDLFCISITVLLSLFSTDKISFQKYRHDDHKITAATNSKDQRLNPPLEQRFYKLPASQQSPKLTGFTAV